jgi:hypothetical protein
MRHQTGFICGVSERTADIRQIAKGNFDVVLLASSWDRRCMCVSPATELRCHTAIVLFFDIRDKRGLRDLHDPRVLRFATSIAERVVSITGASLDLDPIWRQLLSAVDEMRREVGSRPISMLLDLSTCPRYYSLGLVATMLLHGIVDRFTILYSEGRYQPLDSDEQYAFTGGQWNLVPIPGLLGTPDPGKKEHLLISMGFEGDRTYRAVERREPDRLSLLRS